jgi:cell fate (sporulation/competence/biofilm development) regulator YlbF (YheA/YmcA/DUF963 family)
LTKYKKKEKTKMARRSISIDEKIKRQKEVVAMAKDKYDAALNELNILLKKKQDLQGKELLNTFINSEKDLEEILAFMSGKKDDDA